MFTLSLARSAIANSAAFARGGEDVRQGRVSEVTVEERDGILIYRGKIRSGSQTQLAVFEYSEMEETFPSCSCTCADIRRSPQGCRHVAALMIAACGGAGESISAREGGDFIDALLGDHRMSVNLLGRMQKEPVRLYPVLQRRDGEHVLLGLKIGRSRPYVVRSMAELAERAGKREMTVYGRELTFSHRESEVAPEDAALFGQIVMLAGDARLVRGGELELHGTALDQTMRLLDGKTVEIRLENGETRYLPVQRGSMRLPLEVEEGAGRAQLRVLADSVALGAAGAYCFAAEKLICAYGQDFERVAALLRIGIQYPKGVRFESGQLERVCAQVIAPAMADVEIRKGQEIVASRLPMPVTPKFYTDKGDKNRLLCRVRFEYLGEQLAPGESNPHIRRNAPLEEEVLAMVRGIFPEETGDGEFAFEGNDDACFALLSEQLPGLEAVGEVLVSTQLRQMHVKKRKSSMVLGVSHEKDKLVLKAELGDYTQEDLDAALQAYRQKRRYVRLKNGTFLSGEALEQAADAAQVLDSVDVTAEEAANGAELPQSRLLYLEEAVKNRESIRLKTPKAIEEWTQRLRNAQQVKAEHPATLNAQLRSYQLSGLCWLSALSDAGFGGVLADDMGLGKTIQALALLLREKEAGRAVRALVVCPASLQLNWKTEAQKFAPSLRTSALIGSAKERAQVIGAQEEPELMITSYDQLRRDVQLYSQESFTHVLLDEAQNIKNASSQAAKAVKALKAEHRFAMTGTPIENRLSELWSIFDFVMPGYLLTYKKFRERFEAPIVRDANEKARENLHTMVAPFILRRMKKDVLDDLPEKVETVMSSEMTPEQRKIYAAHARAASSSIADSLTGKKQIEALAVLTRLRQICCDPRLCLEGYLGGSGKLTQLIEVVRDALEADHHILLFSQFTSMLDLIAQTLKEEGISYFVLKGDTDKEERMELVQRFNAGEADVFLISLKAGGTGLNLTGADVVIHYDPWWNVSAQNQATDRAYRIGQTKGVQVIKLIASDSVEEKILHLQESKRALGDGVLLGEENLFTMDAEMLREILK